MVDAELGQKLWNAQYHDLGLIAKFGGLIPRIHLERKKVCSRPAITESILFIVNLLILLEILEYFKVPLFLRDFSDNRKKWYRSVIINESFETPFFEQVIHDL